jgi:tetratricopeptide (TPR) repeat protein
MGTKRNRGYRLTNIGEKKVIDALNKEEVGLHKRASWLKKATEEIGECLGIDTIRRILGKQSVDESSIQSVFKAFKLQYKRGEDSVKGLKVTSISENEIAEKDGAGKSFVGREGAIADLNALVKEGKKLILIQAEGGVGKTTLARHYLETQGFDIVIEYPMAKERQNISSVESVVEEWLKRHFNEEPGREFDQSLERLRNKLQDKNKKIGILIDNLEPALENGSFIENHRRYVDLLRVLNHPNVQSLTLITSRERICESGIKISDNNVYPLEGLSKEAWNQFFESCRINTGSSPLDENSALSLMHKAYGGNAEAMFIFSGAIKNECQGDLEAYWKENDQDLLINPTLENLIEGQFNKLQHDNPKAYILLCRLGCYRYQDVPLVPEEGISCLLWEEEEKQRKRVIKALRDRSLIKYSNQEYYLHPVIRAEAIDRLRGSKDWEITNHKAALFWTESVKHVTNPIEGLKKLESYNHYVVIEDWENAASILMQKINDTELLPHLRAFGYLQKCTEIIEFLLDKPNIKQAYLRTLWVYLADLHSIIGDFKRAIYEYEKSESILVKLKFCDENSIQNHMFTKEYVDEMGALGILHINMGNYENAINILQIILPIAKDLGNIGKKFVVYINSCLSIAHYLVGNQADSLIHLQEAINAKGYLEKSSKTWIKIYGFHNLRKSLFFHGRLVESMEVCQQLLSYYEQSSFIQGKGFALIGFGDIYVMENNFQKALDNYEEAIQIFMKIGARYDKAETYYQIGFTYQKMGNNQQSHNNFQQAIQLFEEMEVPKQVEKVRQAM